MIALARSHRCPVIASTRSAAQPSARAPVVSAHSQTPARMKHHAQSSTNSKLSTYFQNSPKSIISLSHTHRGILARHLLACRSRPSRHGPSLGTRSQHRRATDHADQCAVANHVIYMSNPSRCTHLTILSRVHSRVVLYSTALTWP